MQPLSGEVVMDKSKGDKTKMLPGDRCLIYISCPGLPPSVEQKESFLNFLAAATEDPAACHRIGRRGRVDGLSRGPGSNGRGQKKITLPSPHSH